MYGRFAKFKLGIKKILFKKNSTKVKIAKVFVCVCGGGEQSNREQIGLCERFNNTNTLGESYESNYSPSSYG